MYNRAAAYRVNQFIYKRHIMNNSQAEINYAEIIRRSISAHCSYKFCVRTDKPNASNQLKNK